VNILDLQIIVNYNIRIEFYGANARRNYDHQGMEKRLIYNSKYAQLIPALADSGICGHLSQGNGIF
jgi:hypothetical protein